MNEFNEVDNQLEIYRVRKSAKQHEVELMELIVQENNDFNGTLLDIGCASGNFLKLISSALPNAQLEGFDISTELISIAKESCDNITFFEEDTRKFNPKKTYNILIAQGVLGIFEDFEKVLERWLSWLSPLGKLYIFGRFNSADVDTIVRFRDNTSVQKVWEGGLTSYSIHTIGRFLDLNGYSHAFKKFHLECDLEPDKEEPLRSFTIKSNSGEKFILNKANVLSEQYFLTIEKKSS